MNGLSFFTILTLVTCLFAGIVIQQTQQPLELLTAEQKEILSHMSIEHLDDGAGGTNKTIRITDVNVQIVNGSGQTKDENGVGNLLVGYQENFGARLRTGSHNIATGIDNEFTSYGGYVGGISNGINGSYSVVLTGSDNVAEGVVSCIIGGLLNNALGLGSIVVGGKENVADGFQAVVSGGLQRAVMDDYDWRGGSLLEND